jgi:hypothetical protein
MHLLENANFNASANPKYMISTLQNFALCKATEHVVPVRVIISKVGKFYFFTNNNSSYMTDGLGLWFVKHTMLKGGLKSDMCSKVNRRNMSLSDCLPIMISDTTVEFISGGAGNYIKRLESNKANEEKAKEDATNTANKSKLDAEQLVAATKEDSDRIVKEKNAVKAKLKDDAIALVRKMRDTALDMLSTFMVKVEGVDTKEKANDLIELINKLDTNQSQATPQGTQSNGVIALHTQLAAIIATTKEGDNGNGVNTYVALLGTAVQDLLKFEYSETFDNTDARKLNDIIIKISPSTLANTLVTTPSDMEKKPIVAKYGEILNHIDAIVGIIQQYKDANQTVDNQ